MVKAELEEAEQKLNEPSPLLTRLQEELKNIKVRSDLLVSNHHCMLSVRKKGMVCNMHNMHKIIVYLLKPNSIYAIIIRMDFSLFFFFFFFFL